MVRNLLTLIVVALTVLSAIAQNPPQWTPWKTPYGGGDLSVYKTPGGILYAGEYANAFYRSEDNGMTWNRMPDLGTSFPDSVEKFISVGHAGSMFLEYLNSPATYRSTDEGQTWTPVGGSHSVAVETKTGVLLDVQDKTWRSTDGGQTWSLSLNASGVLRYMPHGELILATFNHLYRSSDDGATWSQQAIDVPGSWVGNIVSSPQGTIFMTSGDTIYRSVDGGATLAPMLPLSGEASYIILPGGRILLQRSYTSGIATIPVLMYSDDEGAGWQEAASMEEGAGGELMLQEPLSDGTLLKLHLDALLRSTDEGATWQFSGTGIRATGVDEIKFVTDSLCFAQTRIGLWKSENKGED
jgi:photosystem II stability/assembly factor-like uncharacterized protein